MAQEINCSCEITENEVTICYPPTSSGGGGGISGVAPVGNVPKVATVDTGDVILTLEESYLSEGNGTLTAFINNINANFGITTSNVNGTGNLTSQSNFLQQTSTVYGGTDLVGFHSYPSSELIVGRFTSVLGYNEIVSGFDFGESNIYVKSPNIYSGSTAIFSDDGGGNIVLISGPAPSGGITGVAPVGNVAKVATVDTGDVILTLEESSIDDLAAGLSVIKSAAGGQYINLVVDNTDDDIEVRLNLISNNTATVYQANFYLTDPNTLLTAGLTQDLDFLRWGYDTNGVDDIKVSLEKANALMLVTGGSYNSGFLKVDIPNGVVQIGDFGNNINSTYITIDDVAQTIELKSNNGILVNGTPAVNGTFEDNNGLIVTVTNGIITAIV